MLLDAVNEKIIRVELVRHDQIVNANHAGDYLAGGGGVSIAGQDRVFTTQTGAAGEEDSCRIRFRGAVLAQSFPSQTEPEHRCHQQSAG